MNKTDPILNEDLQLAADFLCHGLLAGDGADLARGKTFFVTGATGLIGSQICKTLLLCNRQMDLGLNVCAFVRNPDKAAAVFADFAEDSHLQFVTGDLDHDIVCYGPVDYIVHGASPTGSRYFVEHPVETIHAAVDGTGRLLKFAMEKNVQGFVYLSSLEVYGVPDGSKPMMTETDFGSIDPMSVRSSYSEGKRLVECLCASYAAEYGVPVKVARLSQTFGAGVAYDDGRVFAEFARAVIEKKDIVLHTEGRTVRSYCYTRDAVTAILTILFSGEVGEAYNVTNLDTACSIREMAELVAALDPAAGVSVRVEVPDDLGSFGYNPEMIIRLDPSRLEGLGWKPSAGMEDMFRRTIASMSERKDG